MTKKTSTTKQNDELIWAIRIGEFVELRKGNQLTKKISKLTIKTKVEKKMSGYGFYPPKYETKPITFKQISFTDGEVIGYVRAQSFRRMFGFIPAKNDAEKLDKRMRSIIQQSDWKRRNLR